GRRRPTRLAGGRNLAGPAGITGHVGHHAALSDQDTTPALPLIVELLAKQTSAGPAAQLWRCYRRGKRVSVNLTVGMMQRHAHLLPTVLENEDVANPASADEFPIAIGPDVGQPRQPGSGQGCEGTFVLIGVDDHLA